MSKIQIAPSILAADFAKIGEEVTSIELAGADIVHFDVMDGQFVEQITFGTQMLKAVKSITNLPLDVHLMVVHPQEKIKEFAEAGANYISFHFEALSGTVSSKLEQAITILKSIQSYGVQAGIAVNPKTEIETIFPILKYCNYLLIMSVQAGLGGQKFIDYTLNKAEKAAAFIQKENLPVVLEMDGGIGIENATAVKRAGVRMLVAGSSIFKAQDRASTIAALRNSQ